MNMFEKSSGFRLTSAPPRGEWYEFYTVQCPICGKTGNCMIHRSQTKIACTRVESKWQYARNSANPSYIHFIKEGKEYVLPKAQSVNTHTKKNGEKLDQVYQEMIKLLPLQKPHSEHLVNDRFMSEETIRIRQYRSFVKQQITLNDNQYSTIWAQVFNNTILKEEDWKGVPGFFKQKTNNSDLVLQSGFPGIMIPYRNQYNQIVGWQIRVDNVLNNLTIKNELDGFAAKLEQPNHVKCTLNDKLIFDAEIPVGEEVTVNVEGQVVVLKVKQGQKYLWLSSANKPEGTGAGNPSPIHVAVPTTKLKEWKPGELMKSNVVTVTEGALKADIAAEYLLKVFDKEEMVDIGDVVLAIPGVGAWKPLLPILQEMEVKKVNVAFDADSLLNEKVKAQLINFCTILKNNGYEVNLVVWNPKDGKGIDDCLSQMRAPIFKRV
ncbi:hypothetical protein CN931_28430 [Bacillus sp. AFS054943]|uniref:DUF3854 domain-containing protein n=1 Tax=Bacillus cereus TaxID=1396 RepID=A0A2C1LHE5_BACCE|nr:MULTISPECIES: DUF3854 domain-containing protein [Bacillus]PGL74975.1 hypothetical protein CN931_28430 [Bacillus sp. AFS054943]PGT97351.1 hypothetical protein COD19_25455 [Bacillus cereus]